GLLSRQIVQGHDRCAAPLEDPYIAFVGALYPRRPVPELRVEIRLPRLVGHRDVGVRRDESELSHGHPPMVSLRQRLDAEPNLLTHHRSLVVTLPLLVFDDLG